MTADTAQPRKRSNVTRPFPILWVESGDETNCDTNVNTSSGTVNNRTPVCDNFAHADLTRAQYSALMHK